jgi:hypothetical protein
MTLLARLRKAEGRVVRGALVIGCVARVAVRGKRPECAARVTTRAGQTGVRARQRKRGVVIVCREPSRGAVALLAGVREVVRDMAGRRLISGGVARIAIRGDLPENPARVAARAVQPRMAARQREEVVTHKGLVPAQRRVTALTAGRPSAGRMVRRGGPRQVGTVA